MKKSIVSFCAVALLFCVGCATTSTGGADRDLSLNEAIKQSAGELASKFPAGTLVAIVAFEAENDKLAGYVLDELIGAFVNSPLKVVDRNSLDYVLKELNLHISGFVDDNSAVSVGKFLGAKYVIIGQLQHAGKSFRYRVNAINVETAIHEGAVLHNVRNDQALRDLLDDDPGIGKNLGIGALNLALGLGSFTQGDWGGGLTLLGGYGLAAGLMVWDISLDYNDGLAGIPGAIGLGVAGLTAVYGFIRPFIHHKNPTVTSLTDRMQLRVVSEKPSGTAVNLSYAISF